MSRDKEIYRQFFENNKNIPIFHSPWWLDITSGQDNWDVCLVENDGVILASLPFVIKKKYAFTKLTQPELTQFLGPLIHLSDDSKYSTKLKNEKKLLTQLIELLPKYDFYSQNWNYHQSNWLPFYWKGFKQTSYVTYVINDLNLDDVIWNNFQENTRRNIRRAENRENLKIVTDLSVDHFIQLNKMTFTRQNKKVNYCLDKAKNLICESIRRSQGKIFAALDNNGEVHSAIFVVWDNKSAYYLLGGSDPNLRSSGAFSLCMWEAIKFCKDVTSEFNFEGSMIESIEKFFRSFGSVQKSYNKVYKSNSKLLKIIYFLRDI